MANDSLVAAKTVKNDEFYTQLSDVEREMDVFFSHDKNTFRDKIVLLPCDDPEFSSFTHYFVKNFERLGLKKLISTSYASELDDRGKICTVERGQPDSSNIEWSYLHDSGDFRSKEITDLRDEADMIITNPPFSLFREFMNWLVDAGGKQFFVIGSMNAITYKNVFPLIKDNKVWLGSNSHNNGMWFKLPDKDYTNPNVKVLSDGTPVVHLGSIVTFTNIEHDSFPKKLCLTARYNEDSYPQYDNYDAIEVSKVINIPSDYYGVMGVPISFLTKYNPEQFTIVGATESEGTGFSGGLWNKSSNVRQATIGGKRVYKRLFVKRITSKVGKST